MNKLYVLVIALLLSASAALASPIDPTVVINRAKDPSQSFSKNSEAHPLVVTLQNGLLPIMSFDYTGEKTLTKLFIQLDGALQGEEFFCQSNIFKGPCGSFSTGNAADVGLIFTKGKLLGGQGITMAVVTPEPGTLILLLTGAFPLIGFARRRWRAARSA